MEKNEITTIVLDAFLQEETDMGRYTSQDICDCVRETVSLTPGEVTEYMISHDYSLDRRDDRLVWVKI